MKLYYTYTHKNNKQKQKKGNFLGLHIYECQFFKINRLTSNCDLTCITLVPYNIPTRINEQINCSVNMTKRNH